MTPTPNIAVIGSGYWGKNLVRNYHSMGSLKLICDKNPTLLDQYKEQYPDVENCLALNDVISRDDIQGLVIASPCGNPLYPRQGRTSCRKARLRGKTPGAG
jgi:predicted dehydrogenase